METIPPHRNKILTHMQTIPPHGRNGSYIYIFHFSSGEGSVKNRFNHSAGGTENIFSNFLLQTLKGEVAENQFSFRDGAILIFSVRK